MTYSNSGGRLNLTITMDLYQLSAFSGERFCIKKGWTFNRSQLTVMGPEQNVLPFRRLHCYSTENGNRVYDGFLSKGRILVKDVCPEKNSDEFLLSITNDGFIKIPKELHESGRVKINGERSHDGTKSVSVFRLSKSSKITFFIHIPGQKDREISVSHNPDSNRLIIEDSDKEIVAPVYNPPETISFFKKFLSRVFPGSKSRLRRGFGPLGI